MISRFKAYLTKHGLLRAGDRVAVAVSGGADSVALLRIMLQVRQALGIVISVAHFNHQIRGDDSDRDQKFVRALAHRHGLDFQTASGEAPAHALRTKQSLETAARELRYQFFRELLSSHAADKVATAHTMDDQAETVLMRLMRGAGTRGVAGIYPIYPSLASEGDRSIIRPALGLRRADLRQYLEEINQQWREDVTNADLHHTRNSVRHELLPMLAEKYNPAIVETLARAADVARAEEEYWTKECERLLPLMLLPGKPVRSGGRNASASIGGNFGLSIDLLKKQPEALQRRLVRAAAAQWGISVDMEPVTEVLGLLTSGAKSCELPGGWRVKRGLRELSFEAGHESKTGGTYGAKRKREALDYEYPLPVPGQVMVPEINSVVHARLLPFPQEDEGYNHSPLPGTVSADSVAMKIGDAPLKLRCWRAGDRFTPANTRAEKKVKELLGRLKVEQSARKLWPVVVAGEQVIWVQGTRPRQILLDRDGVRHRLVIEIEVKNEANKNAGSEHNARSVRFTSG